jgi:hypothetical protein
MATQPKIARGEKRATSLELTLVASFPKMRALAWDGNFLYASRGYELRRTDLSAPSINWQSIADYSPAWWRNISSRSRPTFRLFRDGFHALAVLTSKHLIAAVPGAIVALTPGESKFRVTHKITRGTRPLHITTTPHGQLFWGEYFDNPNRDEVHIYTSTDQGSTWQIAYTFPKGAIRHVHNIVYDPWENCLWILTGDNGSECRILKSNFDFTHVETVFSGNQQARAVACIPTENGLYFSSDTPLEQNFIYFLDRRGNLAKLGRLTSSSIYGCRVGNSLFFSTMVEPSETNRAQESHLYGSPTCSNFQSLIHWQKDRWPMGFFQYGNIFLPDGNNATNLLALTTIASKNADLETGIFKITTE